MATGDTVPFMLRGATQNSSPITKARAVTVNVSTSVGESTGEAAVAGGPETVLLQRYRIDLQLFGEDPSALRAIVGAAASNFVAQTKGDGGSNEKETFKNVVWTGFAGPFQIRDADSGGQVPMWSIRGTCQWTADDTLALVWVNATDT